MKHTSLLLLLVCATTGTNAQLHKTWKDGNTWAIKGKILPWATMVFPFQGINYTVGAEYGFRRVNAIGIDLVYNDNTSYKSYPAANGSQDSTGPNAYTVSRGAFLYYRRYIDLNTCSFVNPSSRLYNAGFLPYASLFARYGKTDYHYDHGYETNNVSHDEWQYSGGFLVGAVSSYVDVNMGPFYKQSYISDAENGPGGTVIISHMKPSFGFRVGVNLFYVARRNSDHLLAGPAAANNPIPKFWKRKHKSKYASEK